MARPPFPLLRRRKRRGDTTAAPVTGIHSPSLGGTALAPSYRGIARQDEIEIARSVRGGTWQDAAQLANWIAGRGTSIVPAYAPMVAVDEGETHTFRWRVKPRYQTTRYALSIRVSSTTPVIQTLHYGSTSATIQALPRSSTTAARVFYFDRTAQSTDVEELSISVVGADSQPGGTTLVESISIEALPRTVLVCDDDDLGFQTELFRPRVSIEQPNVHDALIDRIDNLRSATRRPSYWQFARSDLDCWTVTGTPVSLFTDSFAVLAPCFNRDDDRGPVSWAALVKCSTGATEGDIDISSTLGGANVGTVVIPANTLDWTWIEGDQFDADAEDNTTPDGRRYGRDDDVSLVATRTAGAGTISIATISIWS